MSNEKLAMKDSNIEWIGQIPQNWEVVRLKYIAEFINGFAFDGNHLDIDEKIPVVRIGDFNEIINYENCLKHKERLDLNKFSPKKYDILVAMSGATTGKLAFIHNDTKSYINQRVGILRVKYNAKFIYYALQCDYFLEYIKLLSYGSAQPNISKDNILNFKIPFPQLDEQRKISEFLDIKCGEIDDLRKGIKEKIANLKAYKSSLITKCVTGKLAISNEKLAMKDSGISWIGEIPNSWEVTRIKYCGIARNGLTYMPQDLTDESGILVLRSSNIKNEKINLNDNVYVSCKVNSDLMVKNGDILICSRNGSRELVGKNAIIENDLEATFGAFMMLFRCDNPKYMFYVLNSEIFTNYLGNFSTTTINQLTNSNFGNIKFPLPSLEEQKRISEFLDKKCKIIDDLIANLNRQDEILSEYKKSLIYECVTGKLAMRNEQ